MDGRLRDPSDSQRRERHKVSGQVASTGHVHAHVFSELMVAYICRTCGVQYAPSEAPPARCIICTDPRQYVGWGGQRWTSLEELTSEGYGTELRSLESDLFGIGTKPAVGIGQRGLLVRSPAGNVLWDIPGYVDQDAIDQVRQLGGLRAISASHPHFYGAIVEWSQAFDAPISLPEADAAWVTRPDAKIRTYQNQVELVPGITLIRCGGHFAGSAVLHWAAGAQGRGGCSPATPSPWSRIGKP